MKIIKVRLRKNPYNIYIGNNLIRKIPRQAESLKLGNFGIVIVSAKVYRLYKRLIRGTFKGKAFKIIATTDGERAKSPAVAFGIIEKILTLDTWGRKVFLICLGGGTIGDLGGFIASVYKRGIPYLQVPTTLLSQIDASIGGKSGINLKEVKNIVGTFYQPRAVFIDPLFLGTLSRRNLKEGLAECIKYGIIKNKSFFYFLRKNIKGIERLKRSLILNLIFNCARIKAGVVAADERESRGIRTILNFGHSFAHALEASSKCHKTTHGEAVSLGIIYAAYLSFLLGFCRKKDLNDIVGALKAFSLPYRKKFNPLTVYRKMAYDKKFIWGKARMVLLKRIGKVKVVDGVPLKAIKKSLKNIPRIFDN